MKKITSIFLVLFLIFFTLIKNVNAQQFGLSISPPHLEVIIKPDKSILIAYKIQNFGDPVVLKANVYSFIPKDNYGNITIKNELEGPVRFSLDNSNITLDQPFFLNSKDEQQLLLRIRLPEGAYEGDYYYTFLAETVPNPGISGVTGSQAKGRIGSNILITVTETGRIDLKGKIVIFDVLPRFNLNFLGLKYKIFDSGDPIPIVLILENAGKNMIKPNGDIVLKGNFGEKTVFNIIPQNILAESQRQISASPSATLNCDMVKKPFYCKHPSSFAISGFFIGKYSLSTTINFGEGSPNIFSSTAFIAIPIKFLASIFIILAFTIFVIKMQRKNKTE